MKNFGYKYTGVGEQKTTKDGKVIVTREVAIADRRGPCKECGKNERREGSSRCAECSRQNMIRENGRKRLQKRVEEAVPIKN